MGGGSWTTESFKSYSVDRGRSVGLDGSLVGHYTAQDLYRSVRIDPTMDPKGVCRECCDSEEHPNTKPVILALDVTGSMGESLEEVAKKLNVVMTNLYEKVSDIEFMIMGIGDFAYDRSPLQVSQFESDIRIAEQLDKLYFERGGGGNAYESYTAAWYFASRHTKLDCWNRGEKGILITLGDEPLNPYIPSDKLSRIVGDSLQGNIDTKNIYEEVVNKYDVYHIVVDSPLNCYKFYKDAIQGSFGNYLDEDHLITTTTDNIVNSICNIILNHYGVIADEPTTKINENGISW